MVSGNLVIKEALNVCVAREQVLTRKSYAICECSGNFLNIMVSGDPVVNEALTVGLEQARTRKSSTICECSFNILNIMVSGDLDFKKP